MYPFWNAKGVHLFFKRYFRAFQPLFFSLSATIHWLFSCCLPAFQPQILYQVSDEILALTFEHIDYRNLNHCVASRLLTH